MSSIVQSATSSNGLAVTFNTIFGVTPTEGNFLVAWIWHDEVSTDIEELTSSGWVRMGTFAAALAATVYRLSVYAKFAGAAESTTVAWDLNEVNRRAIGFVSEFQDVPLTELPAVDAAAISSNSIDAGGTSNQVDDAIDVGSGQLGLVMVGLNGTSPTEPSWATEVTFIRDSSTNFRCATIGFVDPAATVQPDAAWGTTRFSNHAIFVLGDATVPLIIKARSSFQIIKGP